jgi:hypothetical protein
MAHQRGKITKQDLDKLPKDVISLWDEYIFSKELKEKYNSHISGLYFLSSWKITRKLAKR